MPASPGGCSLPHQVPGISRVSGSGAVLMDWISPRESPALLRPDGSPLMDSPSEAAS